MERTKEEIRKFLEEEINNKTKEQALEILKERKFNIDMRDHWDEEDKKWYNVVSEMIKEIENIKGGLK